MGRQPEERLRGAWPHLRQRSSWAAALLATASILCSCFLLTEGQPVPTYLQIQVLLQPPYPVEGQNATLTPNLEGQDTEEALCTWHRGQTIERKKSILAYTFPPNSEQVNETAFTGRETAGPGCSLHIRNVTTEDTGYYTVMVYGAGTRYLLGHTSVVVSELLSSPVLRPSDVLVAENSRVTLSCTTSNKPGVRVSWFKDGKPLLVVTGLSDWNRTLNLFRVTKNDAGLYTCEASNPVISAKSNSAKITMAYGPEIKLIPEGTVEKSLNSELKLECTADSVPTAQFQWYFNNTEILKAIKSIFRVQFLNWTDEGNYTCQATNTFIQHSAVRTVYVKLTKDPAALGVGTIAGIIIGSLAVTALIVGSLLYVFLRTCGRRDKTSTQTIAAPSTYENVSSSTQVMIDSSADSSHKYQTLQHADQSVYQQLEGSRQVSQPVSLS